MKKLIILFIISFTLIQASDIHQQYKNMHAQTRTFKSPKEFKIHKNKPLQHNQNHKQLNHKQLNHQYRYSNDIYYQGDVHFNRHHRNHISYDYPRAQRGYRHPQRSWFYAYRYTKADFVDRYGFYYGYFDRRGYMFEGEFYRYDRDYRYQDRLRGRGLFDRHLYYAPLPRIYRDDLYR